MSQAGAAYAATAFDTYSKARKSAGVAAYG